MIDLESERNDGWLTSHMKPLMKDWKANFDMRLTIDFGKIIQYMTKYVTKSEASGPKAAQSMMRKIVSETRRVGASIQSALQKTMRKLIGETRMKPKQEVCHLIRQEQQVYCSHTFMSVYLFSDQVQVADPARDGTDQQNDNADGQAENKNGNRSATLMSLVDAYARRNDESNWLQSDDYEAALDSGLRELDLKTFCIHHTVGQCGQHRNKIKASRQQE